jgi:hypothetical protein
VSKVSIRSNFSKISVVCVIVPPVKKNASLGHSGD